jgi:hypothetical protein
VSRLSAPKLTVQLVAGQEIPCVALRDWKFLPPPVGEQDWCVLRRPAIAVRVPTRETSEDVSVEPQRPARVYTMGVPE